MTSQLSPGDIRAAAEVHRELGPEYSDLVVESFLERVDREIASRAWTRVSALVPESAAAVGTAEQPPHPTDGDRAA